jgi:hypothetical protein
MAVRQTTTTSDQDNQEIAGDFEAIRRLSRDLRNSSKLITAAQARWLVDRYYQVQDDRIRAAGQIRSELDTDEPNTLLDWLLGNYATLENDIRRALAAYSESQLPGVWARSICGIGPVIAAGLLAHIDVSREPTVGKLWRFAGLDPTQKWEKGTKRPWNARLKVLTTFKLGESFVKVQNRESDVYGKVFAARKALELKRNNMRLLEPGEKSPKMPRIMDMDPADVDSMDGADGDGGASSARYTLIQSGMPGAFAEQAAARLRSANIGHSTDAYFWYSMGVLPPAHIHARARRYAVKLFLAHYHEVAYFHHFGVLPPLPYVLAHMGHVDYIAPPNADLVPGLVEARKAYGKAFAAGGGFVPGKYSPSFVDYAEDEGDRDE